MNKTEKFYEAPKTDIIPVSSSGVICASLKNMDNEENLFMETF